MRESKRPDFFTHDVFYVRLCSSRRPFTPPDHWLVNEHIDIGSFADAAM